ncbi:MAG: prolipoprotein diacylglyceryl transferase [Candidatus Margulisiibacteriota bacterium]
MYPELFRIGKITIHSYGFFYALAFLIGILTSLYFARKENIKSEVILDLSFYVIISAIIGARLFYILGQWSYYQKNIIEIFMLQRGGLVFLGGFLVAFFAILLYCRVKKINTLKLLDTISPGVILGYAIGRIGCFLNGCCFGLPTKLPWGMIFPPNSLAGFQFPNQPLHPTQLYASFSMFFAFLILVVLYLAKKFDGQIFLWGIILYSLYRFLVEFLRYSPIHWLGLTPSQWLVAVFFVAAGLGLIYYSKVQQVK